MKPNVRMIVEVEATEDQASAVRDRNAELCRDIEERPEGLLWIMQNAFTVKLETIE